MSAMRRMLLIGCLSWLGWGGATASGQQPVGFKEKFAISSDRRQALRELIPGTEDFYYYHCLHYQNEGQLAEAQAVIEQWKTKFGQNAGVSQMIARQTLINYDREPDEAMRFLQRQLNISLNHSAPNRDRAATLATQLDRKQFEPQELIEAVYKTDRSLAGIAVGSLPKLVGKQFAPDQLRAWLGRLARADFAGLVKRVAEELALKDSPGFGWAQVHQQLSLAQLDELLGLRPELLGSEAFVRVYMQRLAPLDDADRDAPAEQRQYLERLLAWVRKLPPSQNSLKAMVIGNLLRLNLRDGRFDRGLFLEYLSLPRMAAYYAVERFRDRPVTLVDLNFVLKPQVLLPPVGDDSELVRRYLEHFLRTEDKLDDFVRHLDQRYVTQVQAETKILYGSDDAASWYAKLSPEQQKQLRERIELRFTPGNATRLNSEDNVQLTLELKNVPKLLVKIYEVNPRNFYRNSNQPISTDIDLDGLIANAQRQLEFSLPAERRHEETLQLPELKGRGVWVVDLLGGGQRSRALIQKGQLSSLQRLGDAGHVLQVIDEKGQLVKSAHVEIDNRAFEADSQGRIIIPYAESGRMQDILLVDGEFATHEKLILRRETYQLQAGFIIDRQNLVAGTQTKVLARVGLLCNGKPTSLKILEKPVLTIQAKDVDGVATSQNLTDIVLNDQGELSHTFLVPQRMVELNFRLSAELYNQSQDSREKVETSSTINCNQDLTTATIGNFYLRETDQGYRLVVLGRNGEAVAKLPVTLNLSFLDISQTRSVNLATDSKGEIDLGPLPRVRGVDATAQGVQSRAFAIDRLNRNWPQVIHQAVGTTTVLPLGVDSEPEENFSLMETRQNAAYRDARGSLKIGNGALEIKNLPAGRYELADHRWGHTLRIDVLGTLEQVTTHLVGSTRTVELNHRQPVVIRSAEVKEKDIQIKLSGADRFTRVQVIAHPFAPTFNPLEQAAFAFPAAMQSQRQLPRSFMVDSLKLDEEYSYILQRQQVTKYPGNLLPQPSLLVKPWEIALSDNNSKDAQTGDRLPKLAEPMAPPAAADPTQAKRKQADEQVGPGHDFLVTGTLVNENVKLTAEGEIVLPRAKLQGYSSLTILAVHPTGLDMRHVALPATEILKRDLRLKQAFDPESHLAQVESVRILKAEQKVELGDARTSRLQVYATLGDVFQLYRTLLNSNQWDKFEFVTQWPSLTDDQKRSRYGEMACHELNYFLYRKDRKFFDAVIAPIIAQKVDKQLIDLWLLGKPLDGYRSLWRTDRLNTLERVLLASRLDGMSSGTQRWLDEYLATHPLDPAQRSQRFSTALNGKLLSNEVFSGEMLSLQVKEFDSMDAGKSAIEGYAQLGMPGAAGGRMLGSGEGGMGGGMGMGNTNRLRAGALNAGGSDKETEGRERTAGRGADAKAAKPSSKGQANTVRGLQEAEEKQAAGGMAGKDASNFFGLDRNAAVDGLRRNARLFQSLDRTRQWAETQFYQVRLGSQNPELIPPSPFWRELLAQGVDQSYLPTHLDLPVSNVNEALLALASIDLPWESGASEMAVEGERLTVKTQHDAIAYIQSIEPAAENGDEQSILVGQDIYLAEPYTAEESNRPVNTQPLLIGIPYRINVVVTNPTSTPKRVQVLNQIPAGAIPLASSKITRSTPLQLNAYSTGQVQAVFYFPTAGEFEHYGSQVSSDGKHLMASAASKLRVLASPETVDESSWSYIADWGSNQQVLDYLKQANLQKLDLSRIAFRMRDKAFYEEMLGLAFAAQRFDAGLWGYALHHRDVTNIAELLHHRRDFTSTLGPVLHSPLVSIDPREQMSYEHLDYKPLVVARIHQLGEQRLILNDELFAQYSRLLDVMAHQSQISDDQCMELCYYMLLQNRIEEAIEWFNRVQVDKLATRLQYDYFDAYLDFFRGRYERAAQIAARYTNYPVPRWREMFEQVVQQVRHRDALQSGQAITSVASSDSGMDRNDPFRSDRREIEQTRQAAESPALDLAIADGVATVEHRNLDEVQVHYYLMDIELLFSRNPFVSQNNDRLPSIRPNFSETIKLTGAAGSRKLELPPDVRNRNVLIEVTSKGISRSSVMTANSLAVAISEPFGRIQVQNSRDRSPIEAAYVKVYARHQDGSVRFYKDGYTDLRGQFDYVSLSTSDLDSAQRLSILVIDARNGAVVREVAPPPR